MKTPWQLHLIALLVVVATLSAEVIYLFVGTSAAIPEVLVGRILGTLDAALLMVLGYYFTASIALSRSPLRSTDVPVALSQAEPPKGPA